jgi:AraC-like DNA-binding protein
MFAILYPETNSLPSQSWETLAARANYRPAPLAIICGVSLRTLQRHFRAQYNLTVCAWLNSVRLELALERLSHGARVKEVALELGFKQLSSFSRAFKNRFGIPPRETSALLGARFPFVHRTSLAIAPTRRSDHRRRYLR